MDERQCCQQGASINQLFNNLNGNKRKYKYTYSCTTPSGVLAEKDVIVGNHPIDEREKTAQEANTFLGPSVITHSAGWRWPPAHRIQTCTRNIYTTAAVVEEPALSLPAVAVESARCQNT